MAKNGKPGGGRNGAVKDRFQAFNPSNQRWVKYNADTDLIMDVKSDGEPFKGVRRKG